MKLNFFYLYRVKGAPEIGENFALIEACSKALLKFDKNERQYIIVPLLKGLL
jgi:hypothetical protein